MSDGGQEGGQQKDLVDVGQGVDKFLPHVASRHDIDLGDLTLEDPPDKIGVKAFFKLGEDDGYLPFFQGGLATFNDVFQVVLGHEQGVVQAGAGLFQFADNLEAVVKDGRLDIEKAKAKVFAGAVAGDGLTELQRPAERLLQPGVDDKVGGRVEGNDPGRDDITA